MSCTICLPYMSVLHVCLYVCRICLPYMSIFATCPKETSVSCTHQLTLSSFSHRHPRDSCHSAASCSPEWKKFTKAVGSDVGRHWP